MRWVAVLAAVLVSAVATVDGASAQSVADTMAGFGLIGTWATDCAKSASSSNFLTVFAIKGSHEVTRTYYDAPGHVYDNYKIVSATRQASDLLAYRLLWDFEGAPAIKAGNRIDIVLNMADKKFQIVSSQGSDGSYFVNNRKFPSSGQESPWQSKCP